MRSWRTTVSGWIGSAAALVLTLSGAGILMPKWLTVTAGFLLAGGIAGIGTNAKDSSTHSTLPEVLAATPAPVLVTTQEPQVSEPPKVVEIIK
jgi:hypothetical protein